MRVIVVFHFVVFFLALNGCEQKVSVNVSEDPEVTSEEIEAFLKKVSKHQVFLEGGKYLMGDFGTDFGPQKIQYDTERNSKPLHEVELSSFSISKYKITNEEYQFYLSVNGMSWTDENGEETGYEDYKPMRTHPSLPAHVDWYEAEKYCSWLGAVSGLPFSLPTEAQWEYAARSRGQFLAVATDDGTYKVTDELYNRNGSGGPQGINISTHRDREEFAYAQGWKTRTFTSLPVDRFPPNPLGLYAMSDNGLEWVSDWYDPDYYSVSPVLNPKGPNAPVYKGHDTSEKYAKVMRGEDYANAQWGAGVNVRRLYYTPDAMTWRSWQGKHIRMVANKTARCVVNSPVPVSSR